VDYSQFGLKIANFKCFAKEPQGFDSLKPFNVIIGRNNSGKSSLLDLFPYMTRSEFSPPEILWHDGLAPVFFGRTVLTHEGVTSRIQRVSSSELPGGNQLEFAKRYIGATIEWKLNVQSENRVVQLENLPSGAPPIAALRSVRAQTEGGNILIHAADNPLHGKTFRRLSAERHIDPEVDAADLSLGEDGAGATTFIHNYLTDASRPRSLIEIDLLNALNAVFLPDIRFKRILTRQLSKKAWEVFLEDEHRDEVRLSQSGTGIKTVILALLSLLVIPQFEGKPVDQYIFAFEELENNLHPALLRRLLNYLLTFVREHGCMMLLTTHSSVAIDALSSQPDCQIIHVKHDGKSATCTTVAHQRDGHGVLDDLDIRASDLLQSNGVIWVEGPSDKAYINRWIELCSDGALKESLHYQCVFYGGRLLSHLSASADDEEELSHTVKLLTLNRNCCVVMDSDKRSLRAHVNVTKKRIQEEVTAATGLAWITQGKEIENYLPGDALTAALGQRLETPEQFTALEDHLGGADSPLGKQYLRSKVGLAAKVVEQLTPENAFSVLDIRDRVTELCDHIRRWNRSPDPVAAPLD
jgi:putative ATP-dependent endonuclease of OLD family